MSDSATRDTAAVCVRCTSDTCPGRDDILDCQVLIEGLGDACMEARSMLRRRYWTANRCPGCNVQESELHVYGCPALAVRRGW